MRNIYSRRRRRVSPPPVPAPGALILPTPFPSHVKVDGEALIDKWAAMKPGPAPTDRPDGVRFTRCTMDQLRASLARSYRENPGHTFFTCARNEPDPLRWYGAGIAETLWLSEYGWPEAVKAFEGLFLNLTTRRCRSLIPTISYGDEPGDLDVGIALTGDPECRLVEHHTLRDSVAYGNAVTVVVDPFASVYTDSSDIIKAGAAIAACVWLLRRAGKRVRVVLRSRTDGSGSRWALETEVSSWGEPLDLPRLAFWTMHPAVTRRLKLGYYAPYRSDAIYRRSTTSQEDREDKAEEPVIRVSREAVDANVEGWIDGILNRFGLEVK